MSITSDLTDIKTKANGLANNKIINLAYDSTAYAANTVASPDTYDWSQHNNIPQQTASAMKMTETQINKGWRLRFPILNKYFFNAFFGRVSYNLNKLADFFYSAVSSLVSFLGAPNGLATLDASGRLPASQATETLLSYQGSWSAATNTPALSDGMAGAVKGDMYLCDSAGTVTFGTGNTQSFKANDRVVYNGSQWRKWAGGTVASVCEILPDGTGNIDLAQQSDVTKILSGTVLGQLFYWGIGRNWVQCAGTGNKSFASVKYANGLWVAGCMTADGIWWSEDGKNWTQSITGIVVRGLLYANGLWTACSNNGIWWSEDGKNWTHSTETAGINSWSADFGNNLWVAGDTDNGIMYSSDGKNWTHLSGAGFYYIKYANGIWVAGTNAGIAYSLDGISFTIVVTSASYSVLYANGLWIACTVAGMYWSTNGQNWIQGVGGETVLFTCLYYANGLWVAGTVNGGVYTSADGKNWTLAINITDNISAIIYANSIWLIGTENSGTYISTDMGTTWAVIDSSIAMSCVIEFGNMFFAEGMFVIGTTAGLYYSDWTTI